MTRNAQDDTDTGPATPPGTLEAARDRVAGLAGAARNTTIDAYAAAREKVGTVVEDARDRASGALESAREKLDDARDNAGDVGKRLLDGIQGNPVAALAGGLAVGALAAALLPRTEREAAVFGAIGGRLNSAARDAASAAKSAGQDKLDELGLTPDRARDTVSRLFGDLARAAAEAGTAAVTAAREGGQTVADAASAAAPGAASSGKGASRDKGA